jgi:hypothetical protein
MGVACAPNGFGGVYVPVLAVNGLALAPVMTHTARAWPDVMRNKIAAQANTMLMRDEFISPPWDKEFPP